MRGSVFAPGHRLDGMPSESEDRPSGAEALVRQTPRRGAPAYHDVMRTVALLERAPVFFSLPDGSLHALARRARRVTVASGELIVRQDEPGDTIFFVERGQCRVVVENPPNATTVAVLTDGDLFGVEACVLEQVHPASVYGQGQCTLIALDRPSLYSVVGHEDDTLTELRRVAVERREAYRDGTLRALEGARLELGSVVAVHAPRGGSGATTIALNLVGVLAQRYPGQVLLLDLDLPYAHSALLAGLVPTSCLARLASASPEAFDELLMSAVLYHPGGPMILAGALRPEEADDVTPQLVTRAITSLRKSFRYIVVDTSPMFSDPALAAFDLAQTVVLVVAPDLSAVKSVTDSIGVLHRLGLGDAELKLVLNHRAANPVFERAAVDRLCRRRVDVEIGFDGARPVLAAMQGEIQSLTQPRSEIARGVAELADVLEKARRGEAAHAEVGRP